MDISGVMTPAANQASQANKQRPNDSVGIAAQDKTTTQEAATEVASSVVHQTQEVPSEKLPPHLGRNVNVTA